MQNAKGGTRDRQMDEETEDPENLENVCVCVCVCVCVREEYDQRKVFSRVERI